MLILEDLGMYKFFELKRGGREKVNEVENHRFRNDNKGEKG